MGLLDCGSVGCARIPKLTSPEDAARWCRHMASTAGPTSTYGGSPGLLTNPSTLNPIDGNDNLTLSHAFAPGIKREIFLAHGTCY